MTICPVQESGGVELLFYGELDEAAAATLRQHLAACDECRQALEDLRVIRGALGARPDVAAPPGGDWSGFMSRLDRSIACERAAAVPAAGRTLVIPHPLVVRSRRLVPALAMAALLALVTMSVAYVAWTRSEDAVPAPIASSDPSPAVVANPDTAFAALSEQHFERSKIVVLGLANKSGAGEADWEYERRLASTLLNDTRLYRQTAEQRGMASVARVMGDLELVLLQASMSTAPDAASLEQIRTLIRKRDLLTKMNVIAMAGGM